MNESHAAMVWMVFGIFIVLGFIAVYLTPLAQAFGV
jgi:hypothetical protein